MATKVSQIKLKRNSANTVEELSPYVTLGFGEPLFVEKEDCIIMGSSDSTATLENSKVIKAIDKDVADGLGVKWLSNFSINVPELMTNNKTYKVNADGSIPETPEPTTEAPFYIVIEPTATGAGNLVNIREGMTPELSIAIPDSYRGNKASCKNLRKYFGMLTSGEVQDGKVLLFFSVKAPAGMFYINLIGG